MIMHNDYKDGKHHNDNHDNLDAIRIIVVMKVMIASINIVVEGLRRQRRMKRKIIYICG